MENHKIDGCTSTVSSLFHVPLPLPLQMPLFPLNVCKIYSFFLCHISPHTHAHSLIRNCTLTPFTLMPQFFGYYFNVFAHRNGNILNIQQHVCSVDAFYRNACMASRYFLLFVVVAFFCTQLLGLFLAMNRQSFVRICFPILTFSSSPHSLSQ